MIGTDTVGAYALIGTPGNGTLKGGIAFAAHPDSIKLWAKYFIQFHDTANVMVLFKNNGSTIGYAVFRFPDTLANFTQFKKPITWLSILNSDTLAVLINSSRLNGAKIPGSALYLDDIESLQTLQLHFQTEALKTGLPFLPLQTPMDGFSFNPYCLAGDTSATRTTDHYAGTYALKLKSVPLLIGDTMGYITNGTFGANGPQGGLAVTQNPSLITGYYKYLPVGLDTALAVGIDFYWDPVGDSTVNLQTIYVKLVPTPSWTYFEIPFTYNGTPTTDTVNVTFASGNAAAGAWAGLGSTLFLDDLGISYMPLGIKESNQPGGNIDVFPNPSNGNCEVSFNMNDNQPVYLELYNENGQKVYAETLGNAKNSVSKLNLSSLAKGIYYLNVKTKDKSYSKKLIIQ